MPRTRFSVLLVTLGALALAGPALAANEGECATDADCTSGMVCEVTGGSACACPSEGACEPCETVEYRECVPGPCKTDAECGGDLVCVTWEEDCGDIAVPAPMPACAPDSSCEREAPPKQETCEPVTRGACAPKWAAPCQAAADCGAGFECVEIESCTCSGGGGIDTPPPTEPGMPTEPAAAPAPDGEGGGSSDSAGPEEGGSGAPMPPEDERPACECAPSGEKMCEPQEVSCETADQCPSGWSCEKFTNVAVPCASTPDGESSCDDFAAAPPSSGTCYPPGYELYAGLGGGHGAPVSTSTDSESESPTAPNSGVDGAGNAAAGGGTGPNCAGGEAPTLPMFAVLGLLLMVLQRRRAAAVRT